MTENSNTPQVELWQDVNRKLDKKRLENSLALSLPKFIEAYGKNMSSKDQEAFNTAVGDILTSIQNGNIGERTIARELVFKDGKERGTENKRMKQAYGLAANFVNRVIDAMPEYVAPVVQKPIEKKKEYKIVFPEKICGFQSTCGISYRVIRNISMRCSTRNMNGVQLVYFGETKFCMTLP